MYYDVCMCIMLTGENAVFTMILCLFNPKYIDVCDFKF